MGACSEEAREISLEKEEGLECWASRCGLDGVRVISPGRFPHSGMSRSQPPVLGCIWPCL